MATATTTPTVSAEWVDAYYEADQADQMDRLVRLALRGTGVTFRRTLRASDWAADVWSQIDAIGKPFLACYSEGWAALVRDRHASERTAFAYYDPEWRHAVTGEDLPAYLHRVLWDTDTTVGRLNISTVRLCAYVRRPGEALTLDATRMS
jgi:hypothetical protein